MLAGFIVMGPQFALAKDFTAPMNSSREIARFYALNDDCSSVGETVVRITSQPRHGTASVKLGRDHPNLPQSNPHNVCNVRTVQTTQVWYKPERNYVGRDSVAVDVIHANGTSKQETVNIDVR